MALAIWAAVIAWPENDNSRKINSRIGRPPASPTPFLEIGCPLIATAAISVKLSVLSRYGITGGRLAAEQFQRCLKSFLPGLDQLGFLRLLFAKGERGVSVSFQFRQVRASSFE
jgi:hypothetical protein